MRIRVVPQLQVLRRREVWLNIPWGKQEKTPRTYILAGRVQNGRKRQEASVSSYPALVFFQKQVRWFVEFLALLNSAGAGERTYCGKLSISCARSVYLRDLIELSALEEL